MKGVVGMTKEMQESRGNLVEIFDVLERGVVFDVEHISDDGR